MKKMPSIRVIPIEYTRSLKNFNLLFNLLFCILVPMKEKDSNKKSYFFQVEEYNVNTRIDKYLADQLPDISRSKIKKLIEADKVVLDDEVFTDASYKLQGNEKINIEIEETRQTKLKPKKIEFEVCYEDNDLLVINKPVGLMVHAGVGNTDSTLVNGLIEYCGDNLSAISTDSARPGIVHRLDKDTSGLLLVAKNDIVHAKLTEALANREITRIYNALVYGIPVPKLGTIRTLMAKNKKDHRKMMVTQNEGKEAVTHYRILETYKDTMSLLECKLETGRTHQIRVHLTYKKHPLVGDKTYGKSLNFNLSKFDAEIMQYIRKFGRQALHAKRLEFIHPITEEEMVIESELPDDMQELIKHLQ